jgi:ankyrin repeat protein
MPTTSAVDEFLRSALIPRDASHSSGTLDQADSLLAADPTIRNACVQTAAVLGDVDALASHLKSDPSAATARGGPYEWDLLTHLCFSRYLQHREELSDAFLACARLLLENGATATTGFFEHTHALRPEFESVLYGACGIAHNPDLTQLLVDHGADVNDGEVPYHAPETYDNRALQVLVRSGRMTPVSLVLMLLRKLDWHDYDGAKWLLENGTDPNVSWAKGLPTFQFALTRDSDIRMMQLLLEHGTDPLAVMTTHDGRQFNGIETAARLGRGDVLALLRERGVSIELHGEASLIAACALGDEASVLGISGAEPDLVGAVQKDATELLMRFALSGNADGVRLLHDLGVDIDTRNARGDAYWDIAKDSTALHIAAWKAHHDVVALLVERGADVNATNGRGETPLMRAVAAATDSYWMRHRKPDSVRTLLAAGATKNGVTLPTGYDEIDVLLRAG